MTVNSLHPGIIHSEISRHIPFLKYRIIKLIYLPLSYIFKTPQDGAQTSIFAAVDESLDNVTGEYLR